MLCEQIGDEDESREQRQSEQRDAGADQTKHDLLEGVERRQDTRQVGDAPGAQPSDRKSTRLNSSLAYLVCRLLLEKKKGQIKNNKHYENNKDKIDNNEKNGVKI